MIDPTHLKDPKVIAAVAIGLLAVGMIAYNFTGSPGEPLTKEQTNENTLRTAMVRVFNEFKAGKKITAFSDIPDFQGSKDAYGNPMNLTLTPGNGKNFDAEVRSAGADGKMSTSDDQRAVAEFAFEAGPGYDVYVLSTVNIVTGNE